MKASDLIGMDMLHTTATDISGKITDILFASSLKEAAFYLADVTTPTGTAPVLFSPAVLVLDQGTMTIAAHPDDVTGRVDASIHRTDVAVDLSDLPSTFVGPFGNTFSPSMIAALFNARTGTERPEPPTDEDGIWFSELKGCHVRAHVADVGEVSDVVMDDHFVVCENVEITTFAENTAVNDPAEILVKRSADNTLLLTIVQPD